MLSLLVALVILVIVVYGAKIILTAIGAPGWVLQIVTLIAVAIAFIMVANFFGIATPNLR